MSTICYPGRISENLPKTHETYANVARSLKAEVCNVESDFYAHAGTSYRPPDLA